MTRLRAVIVDDEPLSRRAMRQLLDARGDVDVVAECDDALGVEGQLVAADVVFLDVLMPRRSGLEVARALPGRGPPFVVFVTAYDEYAVPAFETEAVDYLSKPVAPERLAKAVARVRDRLGEARAWEAEREAERGAEAGVTGPGRLARLVARVGGRDVVIPVGEIDCVAADGVYAAVHVGTRRYLVRRSLDALERGLPAATFVRAHRSWIVPRDRVAAVRPTGRGRGARLEIVLRTGQVVPLSRRRRAEVLRDLRREAAPLTPRRSGS